MTLDEAEAAIVEFFKGDEKKARRWWRTPNPLLGGVSPLSLAAIRPERVIRFIESAREDW